MKKVLILAEERMKGDGPLIVGKTGLQKIRDECVHFNDWVTKLETF